MRQLEKQVWQVLTERYLELSQVRQEVLLVPLQVRQEESQGRQLVPDL